MPGRARGHLGAGAGRGPSAVSHPKLRERSHADFLDYGGLGDELAHHDACLYCLGTSSAGKTEVDYHRVTYELTMAAASAFADANPTATFCYVSGQGTDSTEKARDAGVAADGGHRLTHPAELVVGICHSERLHAIEFAAELTLALAERRFEPSGRGVDSRTQCRRRTRCTRRRRDAISLFPGAVMVIDLNVVPYDSGHRSARMGRGPIALLEGGIAEDLERAGHEVAVHMIETTLAFPAENAVAFDLARSIAERVRSARASGRFPLTFSGNCMSALGVVAGLGGSGDGRTAVIWFDAHGDFNSPETSRSGFLDGMAGAVLVGWCWGEAAATVPGFIGVAESSFALIGVRDLDPAEAALLGRSRVTVIDPVQARSGELLADFFDGIGTGARAYVHIDLDVLDPEQVGRANSYAAADGLSVDDVVAVIRAVKRTVPVVAAGVAAYDPSCDTDGRVRRAASQILEELLG